MQNYGIMTDYANSSVRKCNSEPISEHIGSFAVPYAVLQKIYYVIHYSSSVFLSENLLTYIASAR